ncbi:hypothetical protein IWX49DRAFT_302621 [Phyllosticta citricarpa]|uniref:Uncharacterized protein n=2 Tax=Phyllosticta TaxID=121621 RepID=A0ABR1LH04_9PEZI
MSKLNVTVSSIRTCEAHWHIQSIMTESSAKLFRDSSTPRRDKLFLPAKKSLMLGVFEDKGLANCRARLLPAHQIQPLSRNPPEHESEKYGTFLLSRRSPHSPHLRNQLSPRKPGGKTTLSPSFVLLLASPQLEVSARNLNPPTLPARFRYLNVTLLASAFSSTNRAGLVNRLPIGQWLAVGASDSARRTRSRDKGSHEGRLSETWKRGRSRASGPAALGSKASPRWLCSWRACEDQG